MKIKQLLESLNTNDLVDLISRTVEVDTFKPKVDEDNIVIAFRVFDENPAHDLSKAIEFSSSDILDTEVSQIPDTFGKYHVFVEITKANKAKKIINILKVASYLSGINEWRYKAYNEIGFIKLKNLKKR